MQFTEKQAGSFILLGYEFMLNENHRQRATGQRPKLYRNLVALFCYATHGVVKHTA